MSRIVFYESKSVNFLKQRNHLKKYIASIYLEEGKSLHSLNIIFCDDDYLLSINNEFLQHNYYTDIITFDLSNDNNSIEGELYISIDRILDNALQLQTNKIIELHRVIFHGCLHLCGYGDKSESEQFTMRLKEEYYLDKYFSK
jgi:rRNA maturation RNase YbeY